MKIAVIFAGGVGARMHSKERPKQFLELHQKPIIIYTIEHFEKHSEIDAIVIACVHDWIDYLLDLLDKFRIKKVAKVVPGGATSQQSIFNGLLAAKEIAGTEKSIVLIHDGVRPLINEQVITQNIASVTLHGSAITTSIVKETILIVNQNDEILSVPERKYSRVAKAPQSFWLDDILDAHYRAQKDGMLDFIDSCTLMKKYGGKLFMVDGPFENIKITTPDDFYTLRAILDAKEDAQIYGFE
ncbi:MAG TPA: IspD/TarI family cytidylyltransferase [Rectinema sp.]|jgi:2-C-methyl-D-erythritol 4-phosphate cytidylyltransferase|nr:IspD/TarI family cytidylyltransferase [Rectinema sp.]